MEERRLAAILFSDIVGYTALMGADEKRAFQLLEKNKNLHLPLIESHHGAFLKEFGDGILASFPSVYDAVQCAQKIIGSTREETDLSLRIGIHEGDVVFRNGDVFGDGVNIASRLEQEASPDTICVSDKVYQEIKNKAGISAEFIGEKRLKNVDYLIKIYRISAEPVPAHRLQSFEALRQLPEQSIIVLPFENFSSDPDQEYFSDGLTEEIITDLSHIQGLLVISRSSAMTFKGTRKKIREIAREVNVQYVLEGSVRKVGNHLRITAQLIDGLKDTHLWAERYSGTLQDVFAIQERVSLAIAKALKIRLSSAALALGKKRKINDAVAYEQYLLARHKIWKCSNESLHQAIQILESHLKAMGNDEYLLVALALAYFQYVNVGLDPDEKHLDRADELTTKALILNPSLAKAHFLKSMVHETRGELREAFNAAKKAVELDPADSEALFMLGFLFVMVGDNHQAKPFIERALELDPLNFLCHIVEWWLHLSNGELDKALQASDRTYHLAKDSRGAIFVHALTLVMNGQLEKASKFFELLSGDNVSGDTYSALGRAFKYALNQETYLALQSITPHVKKAAEMDHLCAWQLAQVLSLIGEKDSAIDYIERASRDILINYPLFARHDPLLENIREEPRFKELMEQVKRKWERFQI